MCSENRLGPCREKKCSVCCDPVKVARYFPDDKIPTDADGVPIWIKRDELLAPENHIDTLRLKTFNCQRFNRETGECIDYESRPDICRKTSCIREDSLETIDEQHTKFVNEKYISIKTSK